LVRSLLLCIFQLFERRIFRLPDVLLRIFQLVLIFQLLIFRLSDVLLHVVVVVVVVVVVQYRVCCDPYYANTLEHRWQGWWRWWRCWRWWHSAGLDGLC